ncbi:hypothetical protein [Streptomyces sp. NPDC057545]|uniref:hypothetical protein n=1 Tax=unclassified Streptomyces TaxID=2593676 RepID=UPI0036B90139
MRQAHCPDAVCHTYDQTGVRLVLIDENHPLTSRTTTSAQATDLLEDLTERIGATFVHAGIDVTTTALFSGVRGSLGGPHSSSTGDSPGLLVGRAISARDACSHRVG